MKTNPINSMQQAANHSARLYAKRAARLSFYFTLQDVPRRVRKARENALWRAESKHFF